MKKRRDVGAGEQVNIRIFGTEKHEKLEKNWNFDSVEKNFLLYVPSFVSWDFSAHLKNWISRFDPAI